jgi:putative ATP-grasp target RiPP
MVLMGTDPDDDTKTLVPAVNMSGIARPFGLTRATAVPPLRSQVPDTLTICPEQQITVTELGVPFILEPTMATTINTTTETVEDGQKWDDDEGDDSD